LRGAFHCPKRPCPTNVLVFDRLLICYDIIIYLYHEELEDRGGGRLIEMHAAEDTLQWGAFDETREFLTFALKPQLSLSGMLSYSTKSFDVM
jgi:hypothetical protein